MDGSGLTCQHEKAIAVGVACKVDEDIEPVLYDNTGNSFIVHSTDVSVVVKLAFEALRHLVREGNIAISINLYHLTVVCIEQRLKKIRYRMYTKIR